MTNQNTPNNGSKKGLLEKLRDALNSPKDRELMELAKKSRLQGRGVLDIERLADKHQERLQAEMGDREIIDEDEEEMVEEVVAAADAKAQIQNQQKSALNVVTRKGIDVFRDMVNESNRDDGDLAESVRLINMLVKLLSNYHKSQPGQSVIEKMGRDPVNIQNILHAIFGYKIMGGMFQGEQMTRWIEEDKKAFDLIYGDVFGFGPETTAEEIEELVDQLNENIKKMSDLRRLGGAKKAKAARQPNTAVNIINAIKELEKVTSKDEQGGMQILRNELETGLSEGEEEIMRILRKHKVPLSDKRLDPLDAIASRTLIEKIQVSAPVVKSVPSIATITTTSRGAAKNALKLDNTTNVHDLYKIPALTKAIEFFNELETAFKVAKEAYEQEFMANFDGKSRMQIRREINAKFPEAVLGSSLMALDKSDLLTVIAERFNIKGDIDALANKVQEVYMALSGMYPNIFGQIQESADNEDIDPNDFEDLFND
jgi:hypothetical protein